MKCKVCGFDFEAVYGEIGKGFIEVHHVEALFKSEGEISINPIIDLAPVCSNCHRMLQRSKVNVLSIEELKSMLETSRVNEFK